MSGLCQKAPLDRRPEFGLGVGAFEPAGGVAPGVGVAAGVVVVGVGGVALGVSAAQDAILSD